MDRSKNALGCMVDRYCSGTFHPPMHHGTSTYTLVLLLIYKPYPTSLGCTEGSLQLVGGNTPSNGQLEICLNQTMGRVCDHSWHETETVVACRQLGYDSGLSKM